MSIKYPSGCNIRLSLDDRQRLDEASQKAEIPPSTLARRALREWLRTNEIANTEKSQPQMVNPPAA